MTYKDITSKKDCFCGITWHHLSNCLKAFEGQEALSASIWAAVFVESLLKDILGLITSADVSSDELSSLITRLRNAAKNGTSKFDLSQADRIAIENILRRAGEIREKRNRLVHDTGMENSYLESDAHDVYKNLCAIIEIYIDSGISRALRSMNAVQQDAAPEILPEPSFPLFLSTITPHSFEQLDFIESFCNRLRSIGIKPVRCMMTDFDRRDPMGKVRRHIEGCHGVIVLGLERSHAYYFRDKEGSDKESEAIHRHYSSAWLQLEAGIAIGLGKDVFVLCQKNLYGDGVFDRNWNSYTPIELSMPLNVNDPKIDDMLMALKEYVAEHTDASH